MRKMDTCIIFVMVNVALVANSFAQQPGPPPSIMPGLEIKRSLLMQEIMKNDSGLVIKQRDSVNHVASFFAEDPYKTSVELAGDELDLKWIKWTFTFTKDKNINIKELTHLYFLIQLLTYKPGLEWFNAQIAVINKSPFTSLSVTSRLFDFNRLMKLSYEPSKRTLTLSVIAPS